MNSLQRFGVLHLQREILEGSVADFVKHCFFFAQRIQLQQEKKKAKVPLSIQLKSLRSFPKDMR